MPERLNFKLKYVCVARDCLTSQPVMRMFKCVLMTAVMVPCQVWDQAHPGSAYRNLRLTTDPPTHSSTPSMLTPRR